MSDTRETLVEVVQQAPDRSWMQEFLEYANELLTYEKIKHHEGDDRLVTSLRPDRLAVTMNSRYVLVAFFNKQRIGFIVRRGSERIEELVEDAEGHYSFDTLQDEGKNDSPDWVEFTDVSNQLSDEKVHQNWLRTSSTEFNRWSGSPSQNAHEPLVQRMIADETYRKEILNEAFDS